MHECTKGSPCKAWFSSGEERRRLCIIGRKRFVHSFCFLIFFALFRFRKGRKVRCQDFRGIRRFIAFRSFERFTKLDRGCGCQFSRRIGSAREGVAPCEAAGKIFRYLRRKRSKEAVSIRLRCFFHLDQLLFRFCSIRGFIRSEERSFRSDGNIEKRVVSFCIVSIGGDAHETVPYIFG